MTTLNNNKFQEVLSVSASSPPPLPEYRYYQCRPYMHGIKCDRVDGPYTEFTENNTQLLFVKSYIPERFDRYILKYKAIPRVVYLEK
jgi:hypothetical protein